MQLSNEIETRRRLLKVVIGSVVLPAASALLHSATAAAGEAKRLDEANPTAAALGYTTDTGRVDAARYPQHQPTQSCASCRYFQGKAGSEWGPCTIFAGKGEVHAKGWCAAFAAK